MTLRLALIRDGAIVPYSRDADPRRAWALSEVSVARHRVAGCPVPAGLEAAAEAAKQEWGRWERESDQVVLAVMMEEPDGYKVQVASETQQKFSIAYDAERGLSW